MRSDGFYIMLIAICASGLVFAFALTFPEEQTIDRGSFDRCMDSRSELIEENVDATYKLQLCCAGGKEMPGVCE